MHTYDFSEMRTNSEVRIDERFMNHLPYVMPVPDVIDTFSERSGSRRHPGSPWMETGGKRRSTGGEAYEE